MPVLTTRGSRTRLALLTFLLSAATNFIWEMAQMGAFFDASHSFTEAILWCGAATLCDAVYTTAVYIAGERIAGEQNWTSHLNWRRLMAAAGAGAIAAVLVERISLRTALWRYSPSMPVVPLLGVGLWPLLQLPVLTIVVFAIVGRIGRRAGKSVLV